MFLYISGFKFKADFTEAEPLVTAPFFAKRRKIAEILKFKRSSTGKTAKFQNLARGKFIKPNLLNLKPAAVCI
ncbi:hypothetical protein CGRAC_0977 [Campylobacter gracilis]|nr:hypothetical protein CGRAC_0977 [Campylobacter gracilis]